MKTFIRLFLICFPTLSFAFSSFWGIGEFSELWQKNPEIEKGYIVSGGLAIEEFGRNFSRPYKLILEDQYYYSKFLFQINPSLSIWGSLKDRYSRRIMNELYGLDAFSDIKLISNYSQNTLNYSIGGAWKSKNGYWVRLEGNQKENRLLSSISLSFAGGLDFKSVHPFISYSKQVSDLFSEFSLGTSLATNPFVYKNLFLETTLCYGLYLFSSEQSMPVEILIYNQELLPEHVYRSLDSLTYSHSFNMFKFLLPYSINSWTGKFHFIQANLSSLSDLYYLNVSGRGFSRILNDFNFNGKFSGGMLEIEKKVFEDLDTYLAYGYAKGQMDSLKNIDINQTKFTVLSDGNYKLNFWGELDCHILSGGGKWVLNNTHEFNLGLNYIRIYPQYKANWKQKSFFFDPVLDSTENEILWSDFLALNAGWKMKKNIFTVYIDLSQIIPLRNYSLEEESAINTGTSGAENQEKDFVYGLGRAELGFSVFIK